MSAKKSSAPATNPDKTGTDASTSKSPEKKKSTTATAAGTGQRKKGAKRRQGDGMRETVESIAIAFVLAFMFKTFQAEAYVIPTGSMAPTLYGRHKDVTCSECGFHFALGASTELDQESGRLMGRIEYAVCSNCGTLQDVKDAPVFNGDRILVNKQVPGFDRFDVVVFKNPEQGHVNYIKRLVGLPNETLRIRKGDLWVKKADDDVYSIQRKPPSVQKDIQLTVYDDQHPAQRLIAAGWPERWEPSERSTENDGAAGWVPGAAAWTTDRDARTYSCSSDVTDDQWLRYRHFVPVSSPVDASGSLLEVPPTIQPVLVADFCSFNAVMPISRENMPRGSVAFQGAPFWVGDLTINATVEVTEANDQAAMVLELVEGPSTFQCRIDLTTGTAELIDQSTADPAVITTMATAETQLQGTGEWDVTFANVDDRLCLWVDGALINFDNSTEYDGSEIPQPTQKDLAPCGIAFTNAAATVSNLVLERDIYYRNDIMQFDQTNEDGSFGTDVQPHNEVRQKDGLQAMLHDPEAWAIKYQEESADLLEGYGTYGEYQLDADEYLMFGDNSSMSKDSRLFDYDARPLNGVFSHRYAVREQDLIGRALYIFWPHGIPFLNDGKGIAVRYHKEPPRQQGWAPSNLDADEYPSVRVPFYPNVGRMKKIR